MINKPIDRDRGKCVGILYAKKEDNAGGIGIRNAKVSIVDCRRTGRNSDYEICVERELVGQGIEVRATGVTIKMLKKFSIGRTVEDEDRRAIIKFLTNGDEEKALNLSDEQLMVAARVFLEMGDETILNVKDLGTVLDELEKYEELWVKGGMLRKRILTDVLNWTSPSGEVGPATLLRVLGENPILYRGEDALVRNEMFKEILKSNYAEEILIKLRYNPELWQHHGALNMVSLGIVLSSKDPISQIEELTTTNGFQDIPKLPVHELLRCIVLAVIGSDGHIDVDKVKEVRTLVNLDDARHSAHVHRILDLLVKDRGFRKLIEAVKAPRDTEGSGTVKGFIRVMLQLDESEIVRKVDARRAVLQAVLSDLRQGNVGSCYGTAIAISVHDSIPHLMVKDLANMVEKGYFVKKRMTNEGEVKERFYIGDNIDVRKELEDSQMTVKDLLEMADRLSISYPDYKEIFWKMRDAAKKDIDWINECCQNCSADHIKKTVEDYKERPIILSHKLSMDHFEITWDDLEKEEKLRNLANEINTLAAEASLNDDKELDKKVQELIEDYEEKSSELSEKILKIELFNKAWLKIERILYVENKKISLLTKGWEYAIMSSELREMERESEISSRKIPPMMRELFKEVLFNKDRGEVFISEMNKVLEILQELENIFNEEQKKQVFGFLIEMVKVMKTVVDKRMTVSTHSTLSGDTIHYLTYVKAEKNVKNFKILNSEKEYSEVILGCMMEAFEELIIKHNEMDAEVRDFLINLKGILGDKLQSKEFRNSVRSLLLNATQERARLTGSIYDSYLSSTRVASVYFEREYARNRLWIERSNSIVEEFLQVIGYTDKRIKETDIEDSFIENLNDLSYKLEYLIKYIEIHYRESMLAWVVMFVILALLGCGMIFLRVTLATLVYLQFHIIQKLFKISLLSNESAEDVLAHFIEANRLIYADVKNHDEWIKYPVRIPGHVCTLRPFNKSIREAVESDEDIRQYVQRLITNPQKTTMAVMDANYEGEDCYLGFELGEGSIRTVTLNSKFEVIHDCPIDLFQDVSIAKAWYQSVDDRISEYNANV